MVVNKLDFFSPYKSGLITDYINKYISEVNNTTFSVLPYFFCIFISPKIKFFETSAKDGNNVLELF
jgi:hypothetical protein